MLGLNDQRWSELTHAYGQATDIPALLKQLEAYPPSINYRDEPYFSLWSALCHQGDTYSASYASVPHLINLISLNPTKAHWSILQLVTCIEISRIENSGPEIPMDLQSDYFNAIALIPELALSIFKHNPNIDKNYCLIVLSAIAVSKNFPKIAKNCLDLSEG